MGDLWLRGFSFFDFAFAWRWARLVSDGARAAQLRRACGARFVRGRLNTGADDGLEWIASSRHVSVEAPARRGFEFGGGSLGDV